MLQPWSVSVIRKNGNISICWVRGLKGIWSCHKWCTTYSYLWSTWRHSLQNLLYDALKAIIRLDRPDRKCFRDNLVTSMFLFSFRLKWYMVRTVFRAEFKSRVLPIKPLVIQQINGPFTEFRKIFYLKSSFW